MKTIWRVLGLVLLCTVALSSWASSLGPPGRSADRVLIQKKSRTLKLLRAGTVIKKYHVALGTHPEGAKACRGDHRTPEGRYVIDGRNKKSRYHWALHISYPNERDRVASKKLGCSPGGDIFIHGLPNGYGWLGKSHAGRDWTLGCIAVTDEEIEEIWGLVPNGTVVDIEP